MGWELYQEDRRTHSAERLVLRRGVRSHAVLMHALCMYRLLAGFAELALVLEDDLARAQRHFFCRGCMRHILHPARARDTRCTLRRGMRRPTATPLARVTREAYRREIVPERALWWFAADGMRDWFRVLAKHLPTSDARPLLAVMAARTFERRWDALRALPREGVRARALGPLPDRARDPRAVPLLMSALYRVDSPGHARAKKSAWLFEALGGAPRTTSEQLRARVLLSSLSVRERWYEVATHLGELLVVLTDELPAHLPHARKILGDICFDSGARYAERIKKAFAIPDEPPDPPAVAMEILRMSEYVFRVNPEHWGASDGTAGWLEGTACPWYTRPGWNGAHCGIFGQFQSGIASVFGLRYHLSKTIPKHGGHTCRIDVKPIQLGRARAGASAQNT